MKKLLYLLLLLLFPATLSAQDYIVESVEHLPTDMTARTHIKKDGKDRQCAVLRFATQGIAAEKRDGFFFQSDFGSEVVERSTQNGEIWLWVSPVIKTLRIMHNEFGSYELHFTKYLADAVQELHTYKVLLKAVTPVVASTGSGTLRITTQPDGATISINGKEMSQKTPYNNEMIAAGKYEITISKERYKTVVKTLEIADNTNKIINEILKPDFAKITVVSNSDAEIFIDGKIVGTGTWSGDLLSGNHNVKCTSKYHTAGEQTISVVAEEPSKYEIRPTPILGVMEISSDPYGATIYIDGKNYGLTPLTLSNIIIGPHELKLEKSGCASVNKGISLDSGKTLLINEKLPTGRDISIATDKPGDKIYVDGDYVGVTPLKVTLSFGSHIIKAVRTTTNSSNSKAVEKTITISQGSGVIEVKLTIKQEINGHEAVDLGLPSGTLWATCNVGANSPEDYGNYYAWGETKTKSTYKWDTYKYCRDSYNSEKKYNTKSGYGSVDKKKVLEMTDDAAHANWGGSWRMPTRKELNELKTKCTWIWTTMSGKNGYQVTGPNGKSVFLPAAGYYYGSSLDYAGSYGYYWSSSLYTVDPSNAYELYFVYGGVYINDCSRIYGLSVRPVSNPQN